ncbi:hypothetical protein Ddye_006365 [Dipteronia dyeriana]|uniref:Isopenicillin N synthase-like Fe(2+) 2OG dioxygenase domain-containing protein n=1 Tax=Dipteronia dyeriana TaxID=168575 RepID=A0AAE0CQL4_9ROSI|nr:hypothetical protein Ddye_006365 [Dipteronia dyeriana]
MQVRKCLEGLSQAQRSSQLQFLLKPSWLQILSNGKYKSVLHRAVVNGKATRLSILTSHGPPLDKVVAPAPELLHRENRPSAYRGIKYKEYIELQQINSLDGKSCMTRVLI